MHLAASSRERALTNVQQSPFRPGKEDNKLVQIRKVVQRVGCGGGGGGVTGRVRGGGGGETRGGGGGGVTGRGGGGGEMDGGGGGDVTGR